MTIQVNFGATWLIGTKFTLIVIIKIFTINLPSQPFLGRHLGFHIFFHHSLFEGHTLFLQLGCFGLDWLSFFVSFFLFFFLFSYTYKNYYKTRTSYPIALKFGTQKAHRCTNFCWNTINRQRVMSDYSRKITPICCHAYRVNRVWQEAENRWVNRLTIEPETFCSLKEIELITRKIQRKNQQ